MRILAKDPRQRFADGGELAEAVRAVQEGRPLPPPLPVPPSAVPPRPGGPPVVGAAYDQTPAAPAVPAPPPGPVAGPPPAAGSAGPYRGSQFAAQSGAAGLGGPGSQARPSPDGVGGSNPDLAPPRWTPTPSGGWTAPPGEVPRRRATRRPLWIALALLLALILAGIATVVMSGGGGDSESAGPPVGVSADSRLWNTGVSMGSMTTRVR